MTEYEEILSERIAEIGDKFILQGDVYETTFASEGVDCCKGCVFIDSWLCGFGSPDCGENNVIFVKEVV